MSKENILIFTLVAVAVGGLAWSVLSFFQTAGNKSLIASTAENFNQAVQTELSDKCQTPEGYTNEEWQEHMSHHPDRYQECFIGKQPQVEYKNINTGDLKAMLTQKNFTLIDTHIPEQAHIPGTDFFIPFNEITQRQKELPADKDTPIVLYCRSGNMSETAAKDLINAGYTNVYNLVGGVNAWQAAGNEVDNIPM
ncbi:MAG: rhodanese-like domain-containing protein [bacterium]|nr:rhodanese-like domain-containing protein [bacterium]